MSTEAQGAAVPAKPKSAVLVKFEADMAAAYLAATESDRKAALDVVRGPEEVCRRVITGPVAAAIFRDHNGQNRDLSVPKVREFEAAMRRGEWKETHQGIAFDGKSQVDGQHRMAAQALAGITIRWTISRNVARDVIDAIDQCKPRKAHEALQISGISDAGEKERIARSAMEYMAKIEGNALKPTVIQLEKYVIAHDLALGMAVERGRQSVHNIGEPCLSKTEAATIWYLMHTGGWPEQLSWSFIVTLQKGTEQKDNGPIVPAYKIMLANKRSERKTDRLTRDQQIATILKAAQHWVKGESVGKFRPAKKTELVDYHGGEFVDLVKEAA